MGIPRRIFIKGTRRNPPPTPKTPAKIPIRKPRPAREIKKTGPVKKEVNEGEIS